jgi:hypothetical protein
VKNAIKTTILLAAMNGVILVIGDLLGGKVGLLIALGIAAVVKLRRILAFRQNHSTSVQGLGGDGGRGTHAAPARP